ncbi:hypothetical protein MTP99_012985 [Tenebrio molitor]|jgi:hypothetical protein|nr:hypothetical protein MTP99_012985 [Tenebrio molitor]
MAPHVNLTPGDVKQMMEELQMLRELVVTLRKERDDTLALLATSDVRSHIAEDDDDDDPKMKVSPSTPPTPESDQAEPSTSVEEIVEPANGAPFVEVRYRKRHPLPHPKPQTSGPDREPPSEVPRKVKKTKMARTPQVSQPASINSVPTPKVAGNQPQTRFRRSSSRQQPPAAARQSAPAPNAGKKPNTGKSFRTVNAKKPAANGNALMDILLGKVLALLPNLLSGC